MGENLEYRQVRTPDIKRIAEMVKACKGVERTMAKFSEDTGINASTLSRIANGKITNPLGVDTIKILIEKKSTACEYTFDDFIRANGMIDQEQYERRTSRDRRFERRRAQDDRMISMRNIVVNELYARGIAFKKVLKSDELDSFPGELRMYSPMGRVVLNTIESDNQQYWIININGSTVDEDDRKIDIDYMVRRLVSLYAPLFLADAWEPESLKGFKFSFAFADANLMTAFKERLVRAKISTNMTLLLIDVQNNKVVKEEPVFSCEKFDQDNYFELSVDSEAEDGDDDFFQFRFSFDDSEE